MIFTFWFIFLLVVQIFSDISYIVASLTENEASRYGMYCHFKCCHFDANGLLKRQKHWSWLCDRRFLYVGFCCMCNLGAKEGSCIWRTLLCVWDIEFLLFFQGRFLCSMLEMVMRWHNDKRLYEQVSILLIFKVEVLPILILIFWITSDSETWVEFLKNCPSFGK